MWEVRGFNKGLEKIRWPQCSQVEGVMLLIVLKEKDPICSGSQRINISEEAAYKRIINCTYVAI
jgi:hypothetical protein